MKTKVVASECCAGLFPQNTLSGFLFCLDNAIDAIEFDVHLSLDGQVVVHHDYLLNPAITKDASGNWLTKPGPPICTLSLDELMNYDVGTYAPGSREEKSYPDYKPLDNEPIPVFEKFLTSYRTQDAGSELWVELKTTPFQREISSDPRALLNSVLLAVMKQGVEKQIVLLAFEWDLLIAAKEMCPGLQTNFLTINPGFIVATHDSKIDPSLLYGEFNPDQYGDSIPAAIAAAGGDWWGPYVNDVSKNDVVSAQKLGVKVDLWEVGSTDVAMDDALAMGADAITLARPDLLQKKIANEAEKK